MMKVRTISQRTTPTLALAALFVLIATRQAAMAQSAAPVQIRIDSVLATDTNQGCDYRLSSLRRHLKHLFHFSTYRLVSHDDRRTRFGQTVAFTLPGGRILHVIARGMDGDMIDMQIVLFQGEEPLMATDFKLMNRGVLLVGGPRYDEGMLIVSIEAGLFPLPPVKNLPADKRAITPAQSEASPLPQTVPSH